MWHRHEQLLLRTCGSANTIGGRIRGGTRGRSNALSCMSCLVLEILSRDHTPRHATLPDTRPDTSVSPQPQRIRLGLPGRLLIALYPI